MDLALPSFESADISCFTSAHARKPDDVRLQKIIVKCSLVQEDTKKCTAMLTEVLAMTPAAPSLNSGDAPIDVLETNNVGSKCEDDAIKLNSRPIATFCPSHSSDSLPSTFIERRSSSGSSVLSAMVTASSACSEAGNVCESVTQMTSVTVPGNSHSDVCSDCLLTMSRLNMAEDQSGQSDFSLDVNQGPATISTSESGVSLSEHMNTVPPLLPSIRGGCSTVFRRISAPVIRNLNEDSIMCSEETTEHIAKPYRRAQSDINSNRIAGDCNGTQDTVAEGAKQRKLSNVAKNVRTMLSIFKRRASDASTQLPSAELVEKWAENFSNLLNDKYGLMLFRSFLCSEYSEENIEFWIACEEYKHLKAKQLAQKAQKIYSDFVTVHAPKEVNLDSKTRLETMKNLSAPDKMTFEQAQSRIQCLMEKDSYPRFLRSQLYLNTLKQAQECSV